MTRPVHGGNLQWAAQLAACSTSAVLDFSASINPLGPPEKAIAAITRGLKELIHYPDPNYTQLRSCLAKYHQLSPEWILPGNGSAELLTWASRELAQQEMVYLLTPAFSDYFRGLNTFSAKVKGFSPSCFPFIATKSNPDSTLSEVGCIDKLELPPDRGLFEAGCLLNNPHNPTGQIFAREAILPYLEQLALVVVDEAFMDFLPPNEQQSLISLVNDYPNLVILRSLTKFYSLPGLRLGYAISHPDRLQRWQKWRDPWSVNVLAAMAGEAAIEDRDFQQLTWNWLAPTRKQLFTGLAAIPGLYPITSSANFLLVKTESSVTKLQIQLLKQEQILIRDCLSFPELGDRFFRIAVRSDTENQRLITAIAKKEIVRT